MNKYFIKGTISVEIPDTATTTTAATVWLRPAEGFFSKELPEKALAFSVDKESCMLLDLVENHTKRKEHVKLETGIDETHIIDLCIQAAGTQKLAKVVFKEQQEEENNENATPGQITKIIFPCEG